MDPPDFAGKEVPTKWRILSYCIFYSFSICEPIKGILGAKKYPVKLANKIGMKCPNPVKVASRIVVLIGVRVTQALIAAIQLTIAKVKFIVENSWWMINPNVAPTKNWGMINPPLQPDVTVMEIAMILKIKIANNKVNGKFPDNSSLISWCPKYLVIGK